MKISVEWMPVEQKSVLVRLMELYNYDFSLYTDEDINEYGCYGYSHIDDYWNEAGRFAYLIRADGKIAGFALVRSCCEFNELPNPHNIAEFFVLQKYRRRGVGKTAAIRVFNLHRGGWEVSQLSNNIQAQQFWKSVVREYTGGNYEVFGTPEKEHVGFTFCNGPTREL